MSNLTSDSLHYLLNIKSLEGANKTQILNLLDASAASMQVLDYTANESADQQYIQEFVLPAHVDANMAFAATYLVLARFFYASNFIASLYLADDPEIPQELYGLVENRNFIHISGDMLNHNFTYLENYLVGLQKNYFTITKDFGSRYNLELSTDIAIVVGKVIRTDKHKIIITIEGNKFIIIGSYAYQLQIDSMVESINAVLVNTRKELSSRDLKSLNILTNARYQQIVYEWNKTKQDYLDNKTIHALFEEQVLKTPNNIAVIYKDLKFTYRELNSKANQLANYLLKNHDIKPDDLITLCLDRSEQMLIAILGVLKSGGVYVPLDPNYPDDRITYLLGDAHTKIVLTNDVYANKIHQIINENIKKIDVLAIDNPEMQAVLAEQAVVNPVTLTRSNNLAYVIYTSGTAGDPKGVLQQHNNIVRLFTATEAWYNFTDQDVWMLFHAYTFDFTVWEIWGALIYGGKLIIPTVEQVKDPDLFYELCYQKKVTVLNQTPQAFYRFADIAIKKPNDRYLVNLRYVIFGGDKLNFENLPPWFSVYGYDRPRLINMYGITETTVHVTYKEIRQEDIGKNAYIGIAIPDQKLFVLDANLMVLPLGAIGELHVGGNGLARGYLNQSSLTAEKFIANPFQTAAEKLQNKNSRLYRTGDLVRFLSDGSLEYIGRNDLQVKIRGYRIELKEIESKVLKYPGVKQAVVLAKERTIEQVNNKYLLVYYVSDKKLDETAMWLYLATQLPGYMLPQALIYISELPVTINGKLDTKALPEPDPINQVEYIAPRNELEQDICEIYAEILNLPIAQVGIKSDFFIMGGDSISSILLSSRLRQQLQLNISVQDIFNYRNVEQLVRHIVANQCVKTDNLITTTANLPATSRHYLDQIMRADNTIASAYLANNLQQGFIYRAIRQNQADHIYVTQFVWRYQMPIDVNKFKTAWQLVQKKYPSLRLRFMWDRELIQIIDKNQPLDFRYADATNLLEEENLINQNQQEPYDLKKGKLIRIYLLKSSTNNYLCSCSVHHIVFDGWSFPLLIDSMHAIYAQLLANKQPYILEDIAYQEAQQYLQEHKNAHKRYWRDKIKQIEDRVDLKFLLKPTARDIEIKNYTYIQQELDQWIEITEPKFLKLKNICQAHAVTVNTIIQYVWHKVLHIYGASDVTVVGIVVSGRNLPIDNIENSVGLFINTLPLIFRHDNHLHLMDQIKVMQNLINEANDNSNMNLADLQVEGERLFDILFGYENFPAPKNTSAIKYEDMQAKVKVEYPLAIIAYEKDQTLAINLKYAGELFAPETIAVLLNKMLFFIEQILENPYKKTLNYINQDEYQQIVINCNKTAQDYQVNKTIHQLFEEQVWRTPNNIAVVYEHVTLTYQELNNQANQLANYILKNHDIKPDDLIALCLDRSQYAIIAILAVLKTGAAYVPIDISNPDQLLMHILVDTQAKIIIKTKNFHLPSKCGKRGSAVGYSSKIIDIDAAELQQAWLAEKAANPAINITPNNLAYVIYTSGTTGKSKGVMIEHQGVVNYVSYLIQDNQLDERAVGSQYANFSFDAVVIEIYPILFSGGTLHIIRDQDKLDPDKINHYFTQNAITYAFLPTPFAEIFFDLKNSSLKNLIVGGDKLQKFTPQLYRVINAYGPTEITVQANHFIVDKLYPNIPIGKPIANVTNYILDKDLNILPMGVIGELYIGGAGLARGYLHNARLTKERFITARAVNFLDPRVALRAARDDEPGKRLRIYKTGDLVRMLPDGNLEYLGRSDLQVKIRGYRIELGEIESKLMRYPQIKQAVVIADGEAHNKQLIAYYVANEPLDVQQIKNYLARLLPDVFIPSRFIYLQQLPLTSNGKVDKKALPKVELAKIDDCIAPRNKQEQLICEAFMSVLEVPKIGINDDFFLFGGNSIQAIRLIFALQENFAIKIADIFSLRTPKKIAENTRFGKKFFQQQLELVKLAYQQKPNKCCSIKEQQKMKTYTESAAKLSINVALTKPIHNVLLTGATGYLGCNLLNQLLELTNYTNHLLIRADSPAAAIARINKKYQFYFDTELNHVIGKRLFIINADLEKAYLGLPVAEYRSLTTKIDSVIHSAALVKHHGAYNESYSANVSATINLLEFTKLTKLKDFHYISTVGVLYFLNSDDTEHVYTEDDLPENLEALINVYTQTKLLGEHQVVKYREYGVTGQIYRVGNLAFMSKNYRAQENIEDNAFYNWLKYLFTLKTSTAIINTVEISQVDLTARAIVAMFDKQIANHQIYHVFNPYAFDMTNILKSMDFKILSTEQFIDCAMESSKDSQYRDLSMRFLLHQGWAEWRDKQNLDCVKILQTRTQYILKQLGFEWPQISDVIACNYIKALKLSTHAVIPGGCNKFGDPVVYSLPDFPVAKKAIRDNDHGS